jgi:hypothetical protein
VAAVPRQVTTQTTYGGAMTTYFVHCATWHDLCKRMAIQSFAGKIASGEDISRPLPAEAEFDNLKVNSTSVPVITCNRCPIVLSIFRRLGLYSCNFGCNF